MESDTLPNDLVETEHINEIDNVVDDDKNNKASDEPHSALEEAWRLIHVALPSVCVQFNMYFIFPQSASIVGRLRGTEELAGFSLGSLVGNLTCLSVIVGTLSAADTLMPRAYGSKHYDELGRLAIRGVFVCCMLLAFPVGLLSHPNLTEQLFLLLGQDPIAAKLAAGWLPIYFIGVFPILVFRVAQRFFAAQHCAWIPVYASVIPSLVLHPICLNWLVPTMGLNGSAAAIALTQWLMLLFLLLIIWIWPNAYNQQSWPGLSVSFLKESLLRKQSLTKFISLGLGGVLALSEWWFWEVMCVVAGSFGIVPFCAHTIAYNIIPLLFMLPLGVSIGLAVRMGHVIATDPGRARRLAEWTMGITIGIGSLITYGLYCLQEPIVLLFSTDPNVMQESKAIWGWLCLHIWILNIFGINGAILRALGMQWRMAGIIIGCLWCLTLPAILWFAVIKKGGLLVQWTLMPMFYALMQFFLISSYVHVDWNKKSERIRQSVIISLSESQGKEPTELSRLIAEP